MKQRVRVRAALAVIGGIMAVAMETDNFPYLPSGLAEVNKMIKEHGDLFSDSQCKVCSAVLISESQKLTHYQSKKHANKVRRYISMQNEKETAPKKLKADMECDNGDPDRAKACPLCKMTFSSPVLAELHYQGKVHAKKLRLQNPAAAAAAAQTPPTAPPKKKPADDVSSAPATGDNNNNPDRFCSICQASFNNPLMAQQHYVGKKHRKQMARQKLIETYGPSTAPASTPKGYPCTICNIKLNSVEQYQSHISGAKHKNQVKKAGINAAKPESEDAAEPPKEGVDDNKYTDNQYATWDEQSGATDDQYAANDDQYAAGDEQFAAGDEQFAAGDEQFVAGDEQFAAGDEQYPAAEDQYAAGDEQYTAGDNQYAPENAEYTEEYQFT